MCGIAGIYKFNNESVSYNDLKKMTDSIIHRGPDGEGHWISPKKNIGFGHRRLSIIDLSESGKQPMHFADGRYSITFNGEIYNYIELKAELINKGYQFFSDSDTEVLLAMYDLKKEKCLEDFDGMFAFAIWDEKEQQLFCARDRFGEKPFHYYIDKNQFVFASEIKQFWAYGIPKKISEKKVESYIGFGIIDDDTNPSSTFYDTIMRLDAAHYMRITPNGEIKTYKYWEIDLNAKIVDGSLEQASLQFHELLMDSVKLRLRSDVAVGSSLSGGLDSSSIVMLIAQLKGDSQKQNTFSARFKNFANDEGTHIETVIKACKSIEANYVWPDEDYFLNVLDKIVYHQDEPFGSASIVAQYAVMELAKQKNVTVLLDGQGADEYLGGYLRYYKLYLNQLYLTNKKLFYKEKENYEAMHQLASPYIPFYKQETLRMKLGRYKSTFTGKPPYYPLSLKNELKTDTTSGELKRLLRYADRNSMAHSREVRLPFLSHKLVEFAFTLPDEYKLHLGWSKYILRHSMNSILPKSICWRVDKIGYESPQKNWLNTPLMIGELNHAAKLFDISNKIIETNNHHLNWRILLASMYTKNTNLAVAKEK